MAIVIVPCRPSCPATQPHPKHPINSTHKKQLSPSRASYQVEAAFLIASLGPTDVLLIANQFYQKVNEFGGNQQPMPTPRIPRQARTNETTRNNNNDHPRLCEKSALTHARHPSPSYSANDKRTREDTKGLIRSATPCCDPKNPGRIWRGRSVAQGRNKYPTCDLRDASGLHTSEV